MGVTVVGVETVEVGVIVAEAGPSVDEVGITDTYVEDGDGKIVTVSEAKLSVATDEY